jgi:hypothetical protein
MRVRVYYNLNKKCFSIQSKTSTGWRVTDYKNTLTLSNCKFIVSEAGRQRVLKTKRKNVHAYVEGELLDFNCINWWNRKDFVDVSYNPYKFPWFTTPDNKIVRYSKTVLFLNTTNNKPLLRAKTV